MTRKERWIVFPTVAALLLVATGFDLRISLAVYGKNLFSTVFEVVGEAPIQFLALFGALTLLRFRSRKTRAVGAALAAAYGLLAAAFAFMFGFATINYINENIVRELPAFVSLATALAGLGLAIWLTCAVPKERAKEAVTFAVIAIVYALLIVIVMNSVKGIWGRLRMREMLDPAGEFTPWYEIHFRGGFDNRFASFPSGHTMNAAGMILITLLPGVFTNLKGKETLLRVVAYGWAAVVGFSRVVAGAHFTTDVLFGVLLSYALFEGTRAAVTKVRYKKGNVGEMPVS
ncbi:MAG: phosphatase PAP2 family protein [Clostridiales bacterium]|nr:phosphatase PAP2 family protein [Clostridiales bacterium]